MVWGSRIAAGYDQVFNTCLQRSLYSLSYKKLQNINTSLH